MKPLIQLSSVAATLLLLSAAAIADPTPAAKSATPMLFDPMDAGHPDAAQAPSVLAPDQDLKAANGAATPVVPTASSTMPGVNMQPVHPGSTPVDAASLLPQAPQVAPAKSAPPMLVGALAEHGRNGRRNEEGGRVTMYPPKIPAAAPAVTPPSVSEGGANAAFTVDVVKPEAIAVASGVNTIIPISKGHLNRIITPFAHPDVKTVSRATIQTSENVLYLATNDDVPIALYVREQGHENPSMDLTLIPRAIPPRELTLVASESTLKQIKTQITAPLGGAGSPPLETSYISKIRDELRATAQGQIPAGYQLRQPTDSDPGVFCLDPTLRIATGQVLEGSSHLILVAQVTNISSVNVEVDETACHQPGVLAVAAWPTPFIKPGGSIELFEVQKRHEQIDYDRERPSLIPPQ